MRSARQDYRKPVRYDAINDTAVQANERAALASCCDALRDATLALFDRIAKRTKHDTATVAVWLHGTTDAADWVA